MGPGGGGQRRHRRPVAVHGKDPFGEDQAMVVVAARAAENPGAILGVVVAK